MITKTLSTPSGKLKITIPEKPDELTLKQVIALQEAVSLDDFDTISILSGVDVKELRQITSFKDIEVFTHHVLSLSHQMRYTFDANKLPEYILFGKTKVKVIRNLSMEPAGAYMAARDLIADEVNKHMADNPEDSNWKNNINPPARVCAMLLAHYFYCRVTDLKYDEEKAEEFYSEVIDLPICVAFPIARHFFLRYPDLLKQKISLWRQIRLTWKNELVYRRLKNSSTLTRLMRSLRGMFYGGKKS